MKYRFKDGIKFAQEVKDIQKQHNPEWIEFADSLINGSLREYRKMITKLSELNTAEPDTKPKIVAFYRIRPFTQTREEDFKLMAEAGFYRLKIGVESGSQDVRNHIGKTETEEEILYTFEMCKKYGLHINLLIIVGYPTETKADFEKTMDMLRMIKDLGYAGTVDRAVVNELYFSQDTGLSKQIEVLEIQNAESNTNWTRILPNGELLDAAERQRRLDESIGYIKENFSGKIMVFSESKTTMEDNKNDKV
jgi:biotin synthase-like enzyme